MYELYYGHQRGPRPYSWAGSRRQRGEAALVTVGRRAGQPPPAGPGSRLRLRPPATGIRVMIAAATRAMITFTGSLVGNSASDSDS